MEETLKMTVSLYKSGQHLLLEKRRKEWFRVGLDF